MDCGASSFICENPIVGFNQIASLLKMAKDGLIFEVRMILAIMQIQKVNGLTIMLIFHPVAN